MKTRGQWESEPMLGNQRAEVLELLDRAERAEAERDSWKRQAEMGNYADVAEIGRVLHALKVAGIAAEWVEGEMLTKTSPAEGVEKLTAERDLLTAQLADVTRQRDECASGLLAMREALSQLYGHGHNLKAFAGTMIRWNEPGVDFTDEAKHIVRAATEASAVRDNALDVHVELVDLFDGNSEDPRLIEALAEHDAKLKAQWDAEFRAAWDAVHDENSDDDAEGHDARVAAEARRAALVDASQWLRSVTVPLEIILRETKRDYGARLVVALADRLVMALAPPAPAPSGCRQDWGHGSGCGCARCMTSDAAKPVCATCNDFHVIDIEDETGRRDEPCPDCAVPR